jgi:HAD superfamily hydrolase (TIGR01509 family)
MIRAVIFDMDGLLVESEVYWEEARRDYCAEIGCAWREEDELSVKGHNSAEWAVAIAMRCEINLPPAQIIDTVVARMRVMYEGKLPLLPGATDVVRALAPRFPLAVASSSPSSLIEYVMSETGIRSQFKVIVSADEVGRGKPAPDVFLMASERLGNVPDMCAVFEDSSAGILAARAAGMYVIAVPNSHYPPQSDALGQADLVLDSLLDFRPEMLSG